MTDVVYADRAFWSPLVDTRFSGVRAQRPALASQTAESELAVLEEMVLKARKLRNSCVGTGRLPAEVLVSIFLFVRATWPPRITRFDGVPHFHSGWMAVTHVCTIWRLAALAAPGLWAKHANVLNTPLRYLPIILSRSRNCPLEIEIDLLAITNDDADGNASLARANAINRAQDWVCQSVCLRTACLKLYGYNVSLLEKLASLVPHLRHLRVLRLISEEDVLCPELPQPLASLSNITELTLMDYCLPWDSPIFSSQLTYLSLSVSDRALERQRRVPSCNQLQTLLNNAYSLQALELDDFIPTGPITEVHLPQILRIFLFRLRRPQPLKFVQSLELLAKLRIPEGCSRYAQLCPRGLEISDAGKELFAQCITAFTTFEPLGAREVVLGRSSMSTVTQERAIRIWPRNTTPTLFPPTGASIRYYINRSHYLDGPHMSHILTNSLKTYDFIESLNIIDVQIATFTSPLCRMLGRTGRWSVFATRAPRLRVINVFIAECLPLLHALMDLADGQLVSFPALKVIVLSGVDEKGADDATFLAELTALASLVHLRKGEGAPLQEVVISKDVEAWGIWASLKDEVKITFV
ncbi:hypothetical protein PENSPDRAFT_687651 [Peniophora sp. CONT]|nr:hypothetical protein PENSPDRAFT_687651 [Peniophora sp. CONT]